MSDLRRTDDARGEIRFSPRGRDEDGVMMLMGRVSPAEAEDQRAA